MGKHSKHSDQYEGCPCTSRVEPGRAYPVIGHTLPEGYCCAEAWAVGFVSEVANVLEEAGLPYIEMYDADFDALAVSLGRYAFGAGEQCGGGCPCESVADYDRAYPVLLPPPNALDEGFMPRLVGEVGTVLESVGLPEVAEDSADYYALMWMLFRFCFGIPIGYPDGSGSEGGRGCGGAGW